VHARELDGRPLTFGHSGWLWHNAYLLYDRETDSLWHHATGIAMAGPLRGRRLKRHPRTAVMSFGAWRAEHPRTLVLAKPTAGGAPVETDVYADRNRLLTFGFALALPGVARFYPFHAMRDLDAVEDEVAGAPLVVVRDAESQVARAFDRRVGGETLSFEVVPGPRPLLRERGGTRSWFLRSGEPAAGTPVRLTAVPGTPFEAGAWSLQNPQGSVYCRP
jgi:uncharacterized protein DUF3179